MTSKQYLTLFCKKTRSKKQCLVSIVEHPLEYPNHPKKSKINGHYIKIYYFLYLSLLMIQIIYISHQFVKVPVQQRTQKKNQIKIEIFINFNLLENVIAHFIAINIQNNKLSYMFQSGQVLQYSDHDFQNGYLYVTALFRKLMKYQSAVHRRITRTKPRQCDSVVNVIYLLTNLTGQVQCLFTLHQQNVKKISVKRRDRPGQLVVSMLVVATCCCCMLC